MGRPNHSQKQRELDFRRLAALEEAGFIVLDFFDSPRADSKPYFVGLGSHGDDGRTVNRAAKACLACCKIGEWWRMPNGELARDVVARIMREVV